MPWKIINDKFIFYQVTSAVTSSGSATTTARETSGESDVTTGAFVEYSGIPSSTIGTFENINILHAESHVHLAQENSETCAGVAVSESRDNQWSIKEKGIVLAWIIKPQKRRLPLTGIYNKTINGAPAGKSVIIVSGDSFIMTTSKDDQIEILTSRFDALTT